MERILERIRSYKDREALASDGVITTYNDLIEAYNNAMGALGMIPEGSVVAVRGEFNVDTIGMMLALFDHKCIYVPLAEGVKDVKSYFQVAQVEYYWDSFDSRKITFRSTTIEVDHPMLCSLRDNKQSGIVFFSSGTTGEPKAALHDVDPFINRFSEKGKALRSLAFLLFDHEGGFNTVMYSITNGGFLCTVKDRTPGEILKSVEEYRLEVMPATPSFLRMLLVSGEYRKHDLSSLNLITYGTEPMPESTLAAVNKVFPGVRLKQTYGLTELGVMRTKSKSSDSLWMKIGGDEHYQIRVEDDILYIKSDMAMIGYLNADAPFDGDGWYCTGDRVEVDGEWIRVLGRDSDLINVGGQKVYPAEVESVILEVDGVSEVSVVGEANSLMGQVVVAKVAPVTGYELSELKDEIRMHCKEKLDRFKIPVKIQMVEDGLVGERLKKKRT